MRVFIAMADRRQQHAPVIGVYEKRSDAEAAALAYTQEQSGALRNRSDFPETFADLRRLNVFSPYVLGYVAEHVVVGHSPTFQLVATPEQFLAAAERAISRSHP